MEKRDQKILLLHISSSKRRWMKIIIISIHYFHIIIHKHNTIITRWSHLFSSVSRGDLIFIDKRSLKTRIFNRKNSPSNFRSQTFRRGDDCRHPKPVPPCPNVRRRRRAARVPLLANNRSRNWVGSSRSTACPGRKTSQRCRPNRHVHLPWRSASMATTITHSSPPGPPPRRSHCCDNRPHHRWAKGIRRKHCDSSATRTSSRTAATRKLRGKTSELRGAGRQAEADEEEICLAISREKLISRLLLFLGHANRWPHKRHFPRVPMI